MKPKTKYLVLYNLVKRRKDTMLQGIVANKCRLLKFYFAKKLTFAPRPIGV